MVQMKVGGQIMDFMVDTEAEHSVVTQKVARLSTGDNHKCHWKQDTPALPDALAVCFGGHETVHEFLNLPD